jgi:radical SAM protein with 4Fe4S-binding SPASM domain
MSRPPQPSAGELAGLIAATGLLPPRALTVAITTTCNLRCQHCWLECGRDEDTAELVGVPALQELVREFIALGGEELCLTGGEPLLHPAWLELLDFCCRQPELQRVCLQTNATLIDAGIAAILGGEAYAKLSLQISLDGCSEATHDLIRGDGSLKQALRGLRCLVDAGLGGRTAIAFTEMRHNLAELPQLLELADQLGISRVIGLTLIAAGGAAGNAATQLPTREQYLALLAQFDSDPGFRQRCQALGSFPALEWRHGANDSAHAGCRFLEKPYVTAHGLLYPCALLQVEAFAGRGIYRQPLAAVIAAALPLWTELLQASRERPTAMPCVADCPGGRHCGGGCLARAYLHGGSLAAREDRCALRQEVYRRRAGDVAR